MSSCFYCTDGSGGSPPCPYIYTGTTLVIDTSEANIIIKDPVTNQRTLADLFLQPGSAITVFGFPPGLSIQSRGGVSSSGALQSITVAIPPLPVSGNVYAATSSNPYLIDCIEPNTNGLMENYLVMGNNIPPEAYILEILDSQSIYISAPATGVNSTFEDLTFSPSPAIPATGTCTFSPVLAESGFIYRTCGGGGLKDVTSTFGSFSVGVTISCSDVGKSSSGNGGSSSSRMDYNGGGARVFSPAPIVGPPFTVQSPGPSEFRVYKCQTCCGGCLYVWVVNGAYPAGAAKPTLGVVGTYSDSNGASGSYSATEDISIFGGYMDMGVFCSPLAQDSSNPDTLFGVIAASLGTSPPYNESTSGSGTFSPDSPAGSGSVKADCCNSSGSYSIESTSVVETDIVTAHNITTTTITTTIDGGTPVVQTSSYYSGNPDSSSSFTRSQSYNFDVSIG